MQQSVGDALLWTGVMEDLTEAVMFGVRLK